MFYKNSNKAILNLLKDTNLLLAEESIAHQYPHCWRCKNPIIFRATEQWFISINKFRKQALDAIKDVRWIPAGVKSASARWWRIGVTGASPVSVSGACPYRFSTARTAVRRSSMTKPLRL
jgi:hypothetical protein